MTFGSVVPIPEEANALQSFMHNNEARHIPRTLIESHTGFVESILNTFDKTLDS